ncbi:MAG: hypothetical protein QMD46_13370 [Methanomicrobiales archaeon]|nr:hypothetical protein [Methanomicrobiales archaeon]MDI6867714.1 hypothetical protein [Methanoculleus sp.]
MGDSLRRFKEINERMEHLKCFYPFFKAYTSRPVKKQDYDAPYLALDVLTLLIEKGRLQNRVLKFDEIRAHVEETMKELHPDREFDYREVTRTVLGFLETNTEGERYCFQYLDPVRGRPVNHYVHLIEYDVTEDGYRITDEGLEFMISIKELPEESRITVSLILFKKQIESGSFRNALETVRNLNLEVLRKKGKKQALLDRMRYGDPDVAEGFTTYTQEVISQLKQEQELFTQVQATLRDLSKDQEQIANAPESFGKEEDFIAIQELATELDYGYKLHNTLLKDYTDLPSEYEWICQVRMKSLFDRRYQFQEALENHIRANLPNEVHIVEMHPLLLPNVSRKFGLCSIFEPQRIVGRKVEEMEVKTSEEWGDRKSIEEIVEGRQNENFRIYAQLLVDALAESETIDLPAYLSVIRTCLGDEGIDHIDLIPFLIELNKGARDGEAYETIFDISVPRGQNEPAVEALLSAAARNGGEFHRIRVISRPERRVLIGEDEDVYLSYLTFVGERLHEV